ncbi:MAG: alpha/beta fold hydrolase [Acidimicrobiia bacterium]
MDPLTYRTVMANGIDFEVSVSNEGGERGLALLLHGFPECAFSWRFQIPMLAEMGYEVWAPNMRGYGGTSKPPAVSDYHIDLLLADIGSLVDVSGHEQVVLVGHDWGAAIAWMAAIRQVRPLQRLIIMNVPHPTPFQRELRSFRQLRRSWYALFFQIPWLPEKLLGARDARAIGRAFHQMAVDKSRFPTDVTDVFRASALQPGALKAMVNYYRASVRDRKRSRHEELPAVETPTLMLWGVADTALSIETTYGTSDHVADLTLRYLDDVSHWVQQEAPEKVNAMMRAWLDDDIVPEQSEMSVERLADPALG